MTKEYMIYTSTLCTVYTRDDRLRYTLTEMWAIVTFCCCEDILSLRKADLHNFTVEKVGCMLRVKIMETN
jgi:hypothetical protein